MAFLLASNLLGVGLAAVEQEGVANLEYDVFEEI